MSARWEPAADEPAPSVCPQCSTPVVETVERCPACGYTLAGVDGRPGPYGRWWGVATALVLVMAYLVALVVVLLGR